MSKRRYSIEIKEGLKIKITMQHLLFLNQKYIVQACKEFKITHSSFRIE